MIPRPSRLVLLGHPVDHSISPTFQNAALRFLGIQLTYEALDTAPAELEARLDKLTSERAGGNVTIPHKERVAARCARLTTIAERVAAANTFWVDADGALAGDNTDVAGFDHLARVALRDASTPRRVALLGAGGAAAAVLAAVERWSGCDVTLFNRNAERRERLAARFDIVRHATDDAPAAVEGCDLVVNATPVGLGASDAMPVRVDALERGAVVVDLVYRPGETPWVRAARAGGHRAADGLEMLLEQGALAFERWLGVSAPRDVMRDSVRRSGIAQGSRHPLEREDPLDRDALGFGSPLERHPREDADPSNRHPRESGDPC